MLETIPTPTQATAISGARFTMDGSDALEKHLAKICAEVVAGVREIFPAGMLDGVLLGGGYGRGEGGVLQTKDGDRPYNDLEFYIFVHGSRLIAERRYRAALCRLAHDLEPYAGLEVEFKVINRSTIRESGTTMFFHDLVNGHHRLCGDAAMLDGCAHHRTGSAIPLHEATRLLMNRCSGLLFSSARLARKICTPEDADFIGRNCAKAELAIGDAVLVAHGMYRPSVLQRERQLQTLRPTAPVPRLSEIAALHERGTAFKLRPIRSTESPEVLQARLENVAALAREIFLWLESKRLGCNFESPAAYAMSPVDKCPETPAWRNGLVNMKAFGLGAIASQPFRYPRHRLLETLPLLLWEPARINEPDIAAHLTLRLQKPPTDFASVVAAYTEFWHRFQ